jgi:hypothetical protein
MHAGSLVQLTLDVWSCSNAASTTAAIMACRSAQLLYRTGNRLTSPASLTSLLLTFPPPQSQALTTNNDWELILRLALSEYYKQFQYLSNLEPSKVSHYSFKRDISEHCNHFRCHCLRSIVPNECIVLSGRRLYGSFRLWCFRNQLPSLSVAGKVHREIYGRVPSSLTSLLFVTTVWSKLFLLHKWNLRLAATQQLYVHLLHCVEFLK